MFVKDLNIKDKKIILRADFNVPFVDGKITDDSRIVKELDTIKYLLSQNCKVIILSHLGRVKTEEDAKNNSLELVAKHLSKLLNKKVTFVSKCYGKEVKKIVDEKTNGDVILLENTRIMDLYDKAESGNNDDLAKYWASLGDIFVLDAFGSCHRLHASTGGIAKFMPSCYGILVDKEIKGLYPVINVSSHPFTVFMGGAKVEDKLPIIKKILLKCDYLLVGGGIANSFLKAKGIDIKNSLATTDEAILNELRGLLSTYANKILLPLDYVYTSDEKIYDIGEETIKMYQHYISHSKLVFVNGTPGVFEEEAYKNGTLKLLEMCKNASIQVILGGGDTVSAAKKFGYENDFYFQSSGGGATLEYIADGNLVALNNLK